MRKSVPEKSKSTPLICMAAIFQAEARRHKTRRAPAAGPGPGIAGQVRTGAYGHAPGPPRRSYRAYPAIEKPTRAPPSSHPPSTSLDQCTPR